MKTTLKGFFTAILCLLFSMLSPNSVSAANYTWNGATSTSWTTTTNWTPNGVPGTNDSIIIVTGSNDVYLTSSLTVKQISVTSGTLNLQSYSLTVSGTGNFNSGNINNGTLIVYGTSTQTFKGTQFGAKVKVTGNSILLHGSVFNDSLFVVKKGTSNDNGKGNNTFNGYVSIIDSASGNLVLSDSFPDTFNSTLEIKKRSTGTIYLAHRGTNNLFNGDVYFYGGIIYSNYYGTAIYSGNLIFNGNVYFGFSSGSCTLTNGKKFSIGISGPTSGAIYFKNFTQVDSTSNISISLTGTAQIVFHTGNIFNDSMTVSAPLVSVNGTRFNGVVHLTNIGGNNTTSTGGNIFEKKTTIINNCSSPITFALSTTAVDTFMTDALFQNNNGTYSISKAIFLGPVVFKNTNTTTASDRFFVCSTGQVNFKSSVTIDNSTSGINFGNSGGALTIDSAASLSLVNGFTGNITLKGITQVGSSSQFFTFPSSSSKLILGPGNVFNGPFSFYGHYIQLNGSIFNSTANITRYGTSSDICNGGNVFNGATVIRDSSGHSNIFYLANTVADDYNADVTFIQKGTGVNIFPAYAKSSTFSGNLTIEAPNSNLQFGVSSGKVVFDGGQDQVIYKTNVNIPEFKKIGISKANGKVVLNTPIILKDSLQLIKGALISDTINLLTINDNCITLGGSDSSYVHGAIKKIGNDIFEFPFGDTSFVNPYHPLTISAPSLTTDSYRAKFISSQFPELDLDSGLNDICRYGYWELKKLSGSSTVNVTLSWNNNYNTRIPADLTVVCHDQVNNIGEWSDLGNNFVTGDSIVGRIAAASSNSNAIQFAIALAGPVYCLQMDANACNMVINGGFEFDRSCPPSRFTPSYYDFYNCCFWTTPTRGTPDYQHTCLPDQYNQFTPRTGDACMSFLGNCGDPLNPTPGYQMIREYIEGFISRPLIAGSTYYLEFFIRNADHISNQNQTDRIGAYLSDTYIDFTGSGQLELLYSPTIESPQGLILDNTTNWLKVSGCFVASGNEKYIILGFFGNNSRFTPRLPGQNWGNYYFIDDVFLEEMKISTLYDVNGSYNCDGGKYLTAENCFSDQIADGTFEINWNPTTGLSSSTGAVVSAFPTTQTTYTATLSGPSACGIASATFTVPASPQNIDLSNTTLTIDKTISALGYVTIGGYLKVTNNSTVTIEDCPHVLMGPGAKIEIMPGCTLIVNNSHLYPCSNLMWSGIVTSDETSYIETNGSIFEGAEIAVNGPTGASVSIYNSTFLNNWESIDILHNTSVMSSIYIMGNHFSSSALLSPFFNRRSYRFISLTDLAGLNLIQDNEFYNSDYGIYGEKCNLYVYSNLFYDINDIGYGSAYGIYLKRVYNSFIGDFNSPNEFHNVNYGVYSKFSQFYLSYNTAIDADVFSYSLRPSGSSTIYRNQISAITGIISQNNTSVNLTITENTINVSEDPGYPNFGICSRGTFSPGFTDISNNIINTEGYAGVYANGNEDLSVFHNTINLNHASNSNFVFGIFCENETDCNVEQNCISLTTSPMQLYTRGITISYSSGTKLFCNNTNGTEYGLQLLSFSSQTFTKGNSMENHSKAFAFGDDVCALNFSSSATLFPDQIVFTEGGIDYVPGNNYDNNTFDGFDFYDMNGVDKLFEYKNISIDFMDPVGDNEAVNCQGITWMPFAQIVQNSISLSSVYTYDQCPACSTSNPSPTPANNFFSLANAEQIADSLDGKIVNESAQYFAKSSLFKTLRKNQNWLDSSLTLQLFSNNTINENIGVMNLVRDKLSELADSAIVNDTLLRDSLVNIAIYTLASIDPINVFEQNEKDILEIFLNSLFKDSDSLTENEVFVVDEIAGQCPSDGGLAVFQAQNLKAMSDNFIYFNNLRSCSSISRMRKPIEKTNEGLLKIDVFPNPCNKEIFLSSNIIFGFNSRVEISDFYGKKVKSVNLEEKDLKTQIDVKALNAGVYYLNLYSQNLKILTRKIIILH